MNAAVHLGSESSALRVNSWEKLTETGPGWFRLTHNHAYRVAHFFICTIFLAA
jgi:hypothetical protein